MTGEMVALVVASSPGEAYDAAGAVEVDYEPLPVVVDPEKALKPGGPKVYAHLESNLARVVEHGDKAAVQAAIEQSPVVIEERIFNQRVAAVEIAVAAVVAVADATNYVYQNSSL